MLHRIGAEAALLVHFGFILFALFGGLLVLVNRRWMWVHLPAVVWASIVNLASWTCPLTPVEQSFRRMAGQQGYSGGFVEHYIAPLVYPAGMPRELELLAAFSVVAWNLAVYAIVLRLRTRRRADATAAGRRTLRSARRRPSPVNGE